LQSYHFSIEAGLPKTQVLLWVYGEQVRAVFDNVVMAEYRCPYDWRTHTVKDIRDGIFSPTRDASLQEALFPFDPHESLVLYRPPSGRRPTRPAARERQVLLFELARIA
jgi:hypothetical protein